MNWLLRWFKPGIGLKRWVMPIGVGAFFVGLGLFPLRRWIVPDLVRDFVSWYWLFGLGLVVLGVGVVGLIYSVATRTHTGRGTIYSTLKRSSELQNGPQIVALGGGTGLSTILRGLKEWTANLTAIVTVTDDGGSSGRLREEFDLPAPGDLRNCLVALAPEEERLSKLFSYRFSEGSELEGHSMGNLLLTALTDITGGFDAALRECSDVLATRGRVLPAMLGTPELEGTMENGEQMVGETAISDCDQSVDTLSVRPEPASANPEAVGAVSSAEIVLVGPGSLYTSILANFLEPKLCGAVLDSEAETVYLCNLMTEAGETDGFTVKDHLEAFREVPPEPMVFDHVLVNIRQPPKSVRAEYEKEGAEFVKYDYNQLRDYPGTIHTGDYIAVEDGVLRHDIRAVRRALESILQPRPTARD